MHFKVESKDLLMDWMKAEKERGGLRTSTRVAAWRLNREQVTKGVADRTEWGWFR